MTKINIPDKLYKDIKDFCELNNFNKTPEKYCVELLRERYYLEKYGNLNDSSTKKEKNKESKQEKNKESKYNKNDDDYNDLYDR